MTERGRRLGWRAEGGWGEARCPRGPGGGGAGRGGGGGEGMLVKEGVEGRGEIARRRKASESGRGWAGGGGWGGGGGIDGVEGAGGWLVCASAGGGGGGRGGGRGGGGRWGGGAGGGGVRGAGGCAGWLAGKAENQNIHRPTVSPRSRNGPKHSTPGPQSHPTPLEAL